MCASESTLALDDYGELSAAHLRNLRSGAPVGASQVTAVVRLTNGTPDAAAGATYRVALRVSLVWPYVIRLADPDPGVWVDGGAEALALPLGV